MKRKKILYIMLFFIITIFIGTIHSFGFEKGDTVKCNKQSYQYVAVEKGGQIEYERSEKLLGKGTVCEYVRSEGRDGICTVKHKGNIYYIKEVNLDVYTTGETGATTRAVDQVIQEYQTKDFSKMTNEELKSASNIINSAYKNAPNIEKKTALMALKEKAAMAAKAKGMEVSEDGVVRRRGIIRAMGFNGK